MRDLSLRNPLPMGEGGSIVHHLETCPRQSYYSQSHNRIPHKWSERAGDPEGVAWGKGY